MIERKSTSTTKPVELLRGPTLTLYRFGIQSESVEVDGETQVQYTYSEYVFSDGEYDLVCNGLLPSGAEWTSELRRIERKYILTEADRMIQEGEDYSMTEKDTEWTDYVKAMREYKMAVRDTIDDEGFPANVEYPEMPSQPEV